VLAQRFPLTRPFGATSPARGGDVRTAPSLQAQCNTALSEMATAFPFMDFDPSGIASQERIPSLVFRCRGARRSALVAEFRRVATLHRSEGGVSMPHKFKVRQIVRLTRTSYSDARLNSSDTYEVIRLMPADQTGEPSYRIKSEAGERAVRESEITAIE
jgi:hypothetical protein